MSQGEKTCLHIPDSSPALHLVGKTPQETGLTVTETSASYWPGMRLGAVCPIRLLALRGAACFSNRRWCRIPVSVKGVTLLLLRSPATP